MLMISGSDKSGLPKAGRSLMSCAIVFWESMLVYVMMLTHGSDYFYNGWMMPPIGLDML